MSFLPKRVKDLPPLESDSEDEHKTPQKRTEKDENKEHPGKKKPFTSRNQNENKENCSLSRGRDAFEHHRRVPKRVSELPPLESDSDEDEGKHDKLNCAILNDSFIMSPSKSEGDDNSPKKEKNALQQAGDDSFLLHFDKMNLDENSAKHLDKSPSKPVEVQRPQKSLLPLKSIQENKVSISDNLPEAIQSAGVVELETPLKDTEAQFVTPQIRSWSIARRPRDFCSSQSQKTRSAIANEFRSQKVLFQTPMAVARTPIACISNDSLTLSLCDTINESGTPGTGEKPPNSPSKINTNVKSKKSLSGAFSGQEADLKKSEQQPKPKPKDNVVRINGSEYTIKQKLGCGGSSSVYLANRKDSGKDCALKIVDLRGDAAVVEGYLNETKLLAKLQGNICVVSLYEYELLAKESRLYMVMEKGDSDLHKILQTYKSNLPLYVLMNFWYQMLQSVNYIHQNGVIHSDLKPANFLMVHGRLKLIDFGIASNISIDSTSIIKFSQAGTFNYISPEALIDTSTGNSPMGKNQPKIKISTKSDVWSLGCILYLLLYQKTPFGHIKNIYAKVNAISSPSTEIQYPAIPPYYPVMLVQMATKCLQHNPKQRPSVADLLKYPFNMVIPIQNLSVAAK